MNPSEEKPMEKTLGDIIQEYIDWDENVDGERSEYVRIDDLIASSPLRKRRKKDGLNG